MPSKVSDLVVGKLYTRREVYDAIGGGNLQSYLPERGGIFLGGCFDPDLNKRAPFEVDPGNGVNVLDAAKRIGRAKATIPVFLKRGNKQFEYRGMFRCIRFSDHEKDVHAHADRRKDAAGVLYFEAVAEPKEPIADTELFETSGEEGKKRLVTHLIKERARGLILAKRSAVRAEHGCLVCEACDLKSRDLLSPEGEACFEVHHRIPIGTLTETRQTTVEELAMLCANCHRIIHRSDPMITVEKLRERLRGRNSRD
jgi:hypothetical protein